MQTLMVNLTMENWRTFQESNVEVLSENEIAALVNDAAEFIKGSAKIIAKTLRGAGGV